MPHYKTVLSFRYVSTDGVCNSQCPPFRAPQPVEILEWKYRQEKYTSNTGIDKVFLSPGETDRKIFG